MLIVHIVTAIFICAVVSIKVYNTIKGLNFENHEDAKDY